MWIHFKSARAEEDQLLFQCSVQDSVDGVVRALANLANERQRLKRLTAAVRLLAERGAEASELEEQVAQATITEDAVDTKAAGASATASPNSKTDLLQAVEEAERLLSVKTVAEKQVLTQGMIDEVVQVLRAAVQAAFPAGLSDVEPVQQILSKTEVLEGTEAGKHIYDPETCQLWWAGKKLARSDAKLSTMKDYCGRNEKTKIIGKLTSAAGGSPAREVAIDKETEKKMMAYYYRKQEEQKKLAEDADVSYLDSSWADPRSLKAHFAGVSDNVKWRPGA